MVEMQEPRRNSLFVVPFLLAGFGTFRRRAKCELPDRLEIGLAPPQCAMTLLERDELEAYTPTRPRLRQDRQIRFRHHGNLGVAPDRRGVGHQCDWQSIARYLDCAGTPGFGR